MLRRETIIALRARHTAFRMALDILYPEQRPPEPPPLSVTPMRPFSDGPVVVDPHWLEVQLAERDLTHDLRLRSAWLWQRLAWVVPWLLITGILLGAILAFVAIASQGPSPLPIPDPSRP